jgi:hypothetical protein
MEIEGMSATWGSRAAEDVGEADIRAAQRLAQEVPAT